jgi:hypothetical protein
MIPIQLDRIMVLSAMGFGFAPPLNQSPFIPAEAAIQGPRIQLRTGFPASAGTNGTKTRFKLNSLACRLVAANASNPGDSSLDIPGKQLPRLGSALGVSEEPNKHVMGQRDALASIVLVHCEIAYRRIDHLKQNILVS